MFALMMLGGTDVIIKPVRDSAEEISGDEDSATARCGRFRE